MKNRRNAVWRERAGVGAVGLSFAFFLAWSAALPWAQAANPDGDLRIEIVTAYNLVVDSNAGTPASYAPDSAYLGATFYNDGAADLTDVFAYIGDYIDGTSDTPGIYPSRIHAPLEGPLAGGAFALTHEGGSSGTRDATRYLGTIPAGESVTVYWLISYPHLDTNGVPVWGPSIKPDDDLWLEYDVWATATDGAASLAAQQTRTVTMRNEISAAANKILPNTANKVPREYQDLLARYAPAWTNVYSDGTVGTRIWTEGVWYDLGNVGDGFDNDGDFVPDRNLWMQPVGDASMFDSSAFRLVRTHAMVVVKLKDGGEEVIFGDDQLYFEHIPENRGAIGLVIYEFMPIKPGASGSLSPYQEVASGLNNEKFNTDFGAALGMYSGDALVEVDKYGNLTVYPGGDIDYTITYTNAGDFDLGDPALGMTLVMMDSVPDGTEYVAGTATGSNTLPAGVADYSVLFSTDNGASWSAAEPTNSADITDIQWWLSDDFDVATWGEVRFSVTVVDPYTNTAPCVRNDAGASFGGGDPFTNVWVQTCILGSNEVGDTVFFDDGTGGGVLGDGIQNGAEAGLANITVWLYWDADGDGLLSVADELKETTSTDTSGFYLFSNLWDAAYLVKVDADDPDLPFGTAITRPTLVAVDLDAAGTNANPVSYLDADFAFAPIIALDKELVSGSPAREGDLVTFTIEVTNRISGDGGFNTYTLWATEYDDAHSGEGQSAWVNTNNVHSPPGPDQNYAYPPMQAADEELAVTGFDLAPQNGNITLVEVVIPLVPTGVFGGADTFAIFLLEGDTILYGITNDPSTMVPGDYVLDVTSVKAWDWGQFASTNVLSIQMVARGQGGDTGVVNVDAAAIRVTSDWTGGDSDPSLTLDPVPLTDVYDADVLEFVSATIPPDSVVTNGAAPDSIGTLYWDNVGPLYEGGAKTISVTFRALEPPTNMTTTITNTAYVSNVFYGDGRPANSATDSVPVEVQPAGSIGDFVWRDLNADGVQDGGDEAGISGVSIVLTPPGAVDLGNGAGNPVTNVTDANGYYLFGGIPADGAYTVTVLTATLPGGAGTNTWDEDGLLTNANNETVVNLDYDATDGLDTHDTADFGYDTSSTIEGTIWNDVNRDGDPAPDSGEPWLTTVTVYLYAGATGGVPASAIATNVTDTDGFFRFFGDYDGTYSVVVVTNTGDMSTGTWVQTFDTDGLATLNLAADSVVTGGTARVDFSYYLAGTYMIGDTIFYDWDGNGVQDAEDEGIPNITVTLYEDENGDGVVDVGVDGLVGTRVTNVDGRYLFQTLPPTNYIVIVEEADPDFPPRVVNTADPFGPNDGESALVLTTNRLDQDFGYQPIGNGAIGDTVWHDINADGVQGGPLEVGLGLVTVNLRVDWNGDGFWELIATTETDTNGMYLFSDLPDGDYRVSVDTVDPDLPEDTFGTTYVPTTTTEYGPTVTNGSRYLDADFGFAQLGAIGDTIFWDANQNGTQDPNEDGISGVTVNLYRDLDEDGYYTAGIDVHYGTDFTDANGNYLFSGLATGRYVVVVVKAGPIANAELMADPSCDGLPATDPDAVDADGEYGIPIYPGTSYMGADFGYVPPGIIGDTVWIDTDSDGILDDTEVGIPYITVELWTNGTLMASNETDSAGVYLFMNLPDGTYTVIVNTNDPDFHPDLGQVYDPDTVTNHTATDIVISNQHVVTVDGIPYTNDLAIDFGYRYAGTNVLSGTVGLESAPIDGVMGSGPSGVSSNEVPYSGVNVYLYLWDDADTNAVIDPGETLRVNVTSTTTNGDYSFADLPDGDGDDNYIVSLAAPDDYLLLTTTSGVTPATSVVNTTDLLGYTVSAYQVVPVAPVTTDMDFAFETDVDYDYGDLPSSYGTRMEDTPAGARHLVAVVPDLYLGATVETEFNGTPTADASGDGSEEDGVVSLSVWQEGPAGGQVQVTVGAGSGWLVGYIDFAGDGDMTDGGERVIDEAVSTNAAGGAGIYTNAFTIPAGAISATNTTSLYARFRLVPEEPAFPEFLYAGTADNGEVEDYLWLFGALGDFVWKDVDGNGAYDGVDYPLANIHVFVDLNEDGQYQTNEPDTVTDTAGWYSMGGFSTGAWAIAVDTSSLPNYVVPSYDLDSTNTPHTALVPMTNGQVRWDVDFGYVGMALGGLAWHDSNVNGLQDEGALVGISNIEVRLYTDQTNLLATTQTGTNGTYLFDVTEPGGFFIEFFPIEYVVSPIDVGANDAIDSDVSVSAPYRAENITLAAGERELDWDMGLSRPVESNSVGDYVWFDYDRDGRQDTNEVGVPNITVELYDGVTNLVGTTLTDSQGGYYFAGLSSNDYLLRFVPPASYDFSPPGVGAEEQDSDADPGSGYTAAFTVTNGYVNHDWDAGIYQVIDLAVLKDVNDAVPDEQDVIWWTVTLSNAGPDNASEIELTDIWPTNLSFLGSAPSQGAYDGTNDVWDVGALLVDATATLVLTGQVHVGTAGLTITNEMGVTHAREPDTNPANDTAWATLLVTALDLGVTKTVDDPNPWAGSNVTYTIVITNYGVDNATGVLLVEPLTNDLTYASHTVTAGSYDDVTGIWDIGALPVGLSETLTITATVASNVYGIGITNVSAITDVDQADTNSLNNSDDAIIYVRGADLAVDKSVDNPGPNEWDTVNYTIAVTNLGPNAVTNFWLSEPLADGLNYVSHTTSQGTYSTNDWLWNIGPVGVWSGAVMTIECTVGGATKFTYITNHSVITVSDLPDPVLTNNEDEVIVGVADLQISKTSDVVTVTYPGSNIQYTVIITNQGVPPHPNVYLYDPVPEGVVYVPGSTTITEPYTTNYTVRDNWETVAFTNDDGSVSWLNDWQEEGESDGAGTGNVQVEGVAQCLAIEQTGNGVWRQADLSGARWAWLSFDYRRQDIDGPEDWVGIYASSVGGAIWFEIGRISGPVGGSKYSDADWISTNFNMAPYISSNTAIRFHAQSMDNDDFVKFDNVEISYSGRLYRTVSGPAPPTFWENNILYEDEYVSVTYTCQVISPPTTLWITNTAHVASDLMPLGRDASTDDPVAHADLAVVKSVSTNSPGLGETILYDIVLSNLGPNDTTGVEVTDVLPADVSYDSHSNGTYNSGSGIWTVGPLAVGGSTTLYVWANVVGPWGLAITNAAEVTASDLYDPVVTNNHDDAVLVPTLVLLAGFRAYEGGGHTIVEWDTASEHGTIGFYLERLDRAAGKYERVNKQLLPALFDAPRGGTYRVADPVAKVGGAYRYRLVEVEYRGGRRIYGPIDVVVQALGPGVDILSGRDSELDVPGSEVVSGVPSRQAHGRSAFSKARLAAHKRGKSAAPKKQGSRVKIGVRAQGICRVSAMEIAEALGQSERVVKRWLKTGRLKLTNRGEDVAWLDMNGGLCFYGETVDSIYTCDNVYWLEYGKGRRIEKQGAQPSDRVPERGTVLPDGETFRENLHVEEDRFAPTALFDDPEADYWLWDYFMGGSAAHGIRFFDFGVAGLGEMDCTAVVRVRLHGATASGGTLDHHALIRLNGEDVGDIRWVGAAAVEVSFELAQALLQEGTNVCEIESVLDAGVPYSVFYLDSFDIEYQRRHVAVGDRLAFPGEAPERVTVTGFDASDLLALDVTEAGTPILLQISVDGGPGEYSACFVTELGRRYVVSSQQGFLTSEWVTGADSSDLRSAPNETSYVVLYGEGLADGAEALAERRRAQGLRTKVVSVSEIYDAFNWGLVSPHAIGEFLSFAVSEWAVSPRYAVLVGEGTYDYRDNRGYGGCLIPTLMVNTPSGLRASDNRLADTDNDGVPDLAIGRLPVLTSDELTGVLAKIVAYEEGGNWRDRVVVLADNSDSGGSFEDDSDRIAALIPTEYGVEKLYLSQTSVSALRARLLAAMNEGCGLVNYLGHAGPGRLAAEGLLRTSHVSRLMNGTRAPVMFLMTCSVGRFAIPGYDSLGEALAAKPDGGATAVWAPTALAWHFANRYLNKLAMDGLFDARNRRLGDVLLPALRTYGVSGSSPHLVDTYCLLGDPALHMAPLAAPDVEAWKTQYFTPAEMADLLIGGDLADPDGDGIQNLLEYALGLHPKDGKLQRVLRAGMKAGTGGPSVSFRRRRGGGNVRYLVEICTDLAAGEWQDASRFLSETSRRVVGPDMEELTFQIVNLPADCPVWFIRLKVVRTK